MSDWISAEHELPGDGQWVILLANGVVQDQTYLCEYDQKRDETIWVNPFMEDYHDGAVVQNQHKWMPLPTTHTT